MPYNPFFLPFSLGKNKESRKKRKREKDVILVSHAPPFFSFHVLWEKIVPSSFPLEKTFCWKPFSPLGSLTCAIRYYPFYACVEWQLMRARFPRRKTNRKNRSHAPKRDTRGFKMSPRHFLSPSSHPCFKRSKEDDFAVLLGEGKGEKTHL